MKNTILASLFFALSIGSTAFANAEDNSAAPSEKPEKIRYYSINSITCDGKKVDLGASEQIIVTDKALMLSKEISGDETNTCYSIEIYAPMVNSILQVNGSYQTNLSLIRMASRTQCNSLIAGVKPTIADNIDEQNLTLTATLDNAITDTKVKEITLTVGGGANFCEGKTMEIKATKKPAQ